jgi:hypothetical protein
MSINIIGSNDKSLKLITENIIPNKINKIILEYDLLINKYNNQINTTIINKSKYTHLISQLIKLFNFDDIESLIIYINNINNTNNLEKLIWNFIDQFNLYSKLNDCLFKIFDKLILLKIINKNELIELNNNYSLTLKFIYQKLKQIENNNINNPLNIINQQLEKLDLELKKLNYIRIKKFKHLLIFNNTIYNDNFMNNLILSINNNIYIYKIIKSNILNIDNIINIIIENLYKIYINI